MQDRAETRSIDLADVAGNWKLDAGASSVAFSARGMWGLLPVTGSFGDISGYLDMPPQSRARGEVVIDPSTIDTHMGTRDRHLIGKNFLAVVCHEHGTSVT